MSREYRRIYNGMGVIVESLMGLDNAENKQVLPIIYDEIVVYDQIVMARKKSKWTVHHLDGTLMLDESYDDYIYWYACKCIRLETYDGKYGLLNDKGHLVIFPICESLALTTPNTVKAVIDGGNNIF